MATTVITKEDGRKRATNSLSELALRAAQFTGGAIDETTRDRKCKKAAVVNYKDAEQFEEDDSEIEAQSRIRKTWTHPDSGKTYFITIIDPKKPRGRSKKSRAAAGAQIDAATADASNHLLARRRSAVQMTDDEAALVLLSLEVYVAESADGAPPRP